METVGIFKANAKSTQHNDHGFAGGHSLILNGIERIALALILVVSLPRLTVTGRKLTDGSQQAVTVEDLELILELAGAEHLNGVTQSTVALGGAFVLGGRAVLNDQGNFNGGGI